MLKERIKKLRKALNLTQQEFADRLGISRGNIATYETREGSPGSSVINLMCREFNVSETWLRTGEGDMFVELPKNEVLAAQIENFLKGGTDSFRERLVSLLLRLPPEQWEALEGYLRELIDPPPSAPSTKLYIAARDGFRMEVEVDGKITLPEEDADIPE